MVDNHQKHSGAPVYDSYSKLAHKTPIAMVYGTYNYS